MNVTLCSAFRSASRYLDRYFAQMAGLQACLEERGDSLRLILGEGDHADTTRFLLPEAALDFDAEIVSLDHGQLDYGSVVHPIRFASLAQVWEQIWSKIPESADVILFVEADLAWEPSTLVALIDHLETYPAVAPLIMLQRNGYGADAHYDSWGMRKDGKMFTLYPPYFDGWPTTEMTQLDSAGSCVAMRGEYARQVEWRADDLIMGICHQIYDLGGSVWLDPTQRVIHL